MLFRSICRFSRPVKGIQQSHRLAGRFVTTDAASSHAEKADVPEASLDHSGQSVTSS